MTVAEAIDSFLFHCRYEKNLSPKTLKAYESDLRQFSGFLGPPPGPAGISEVGKSTLRDYIRHLFARFAEKTIKRKVASLKALYNHLEREDVVGVNPFRKMDVRIKEKQRLPRTIPLPSLVQLLQHLYRLRLGAAEFRDEQYRLVVRDIAVTEVLFATAIRVSELCTLRQEDVDLSTGRIRILGKGGRERMIHICSSETLASLAEYTSLYHGGPGTDILFLRTRLGSALSDQTVRRLLRNRANEAGVTEVVTPHAIRHSVATFLLEKGVDIRYIQHLLGHRSITTTQIYTHVTNTEYRRILETHHPRGHVSIRI